MGQQASPPLFRAAVATALQSSLQALASHHASLPGGKELEEGGCSGEEKSIDEVGRKEACSGWGTKVCRQPSFIIAVVGGTSVFVTKKKACKKSFLHRSLSLLGKHVCTS